MSQELDASGKLIDQAVKPLINGALVFAGAKMLGLSGSVPLPLIEKYYEAPIALGILGVASSFGSELAHNFLLPHINQHSKFGQMEAMALSPVINGSLLAAGVYAGSPIVLQSLGAMKIAGLGAAAEIGNTYAFETFLRPFLHTRAAN